MAIKKRRVVSRKFYNPKTLHKEREYGFYWYSWLWRLIRPLLIFCIIGEAILGGGGMSGIVYALDLPLTWLMLRGSWKLLR